MPLQFFGRATLTFWVADEQHRSSTRSASPVITGSAEEEHQRAKGSVLTPQHSEHATPSAVLSSSRPAGHGLTLGIECPAVQSALPLVATGTESAGRLTGKAAMALSRPRSPPGDRS